MMLFLKKEKTMFMKSDSYCRHIMLSLLTCSFLCLLVACGSVNTSSGSSSVHTKQTVSGTTILTNGGQTAGDGGNATPVTTTVAMPSTQTNCPASETGRAAVMAPLAAQGHQTLVYVVNEAASTIHPMTATLKRLDIATSSKVNIVKLNATAIVNAQVSTDGQWVLFIASSNNVNKLQLIRIDGQGLQTLYCSTTNANLGGDVAWSNNQHTVIFSLLGVKGGPMSGIYQFDLRTGKVQLDLTTPMHILTMLDNTRVYVAIPATDAPSSTLAILNTSKGANQQTKDLQVVYQQTPPNGNYPCWDADSSYDASTLYVSQCIAVSSTTGPGIAGYTGPSTLGNQAPTGGTLHNFYTNNQLAITRVRAVSTNTLLLQTKTVNTPYGSMLNGLWAIRIDGTGRVRLASEGTLNSFSQTLWANVARDGMQYAFQNVLPDGTYRVGFGSLDGTQTNIIEAVAGGGSTAAIAGWTTF
jgi:hypothetical protein